MAKKTSRRDRRDVKKTRRIPSHYPGASAPTETSSAAAPVRERERTPAQRGLAPASQRRRAASAPFREDYSYVYRDLRRIVVLAAAMFAILIALSFVLR